MEIGIQVSSLKPLLRTAGQVADAFGRLRAMGFVYAQLQWIDRGVSRDEVGGALAASGLVCLGTQDRFNDVLPFLDREIGDNLAWGGSDVCVSGVPERYRTGGRFSQYLAALNDAAARCADAGLSLSFHPLPGDYDGAPGGTFVDRILDGVTVPIRIVLDFYNLSRAGQEPLVWINKLAGRVDMVHCKDGTVREGEAVLTPVGQGDISWETIVPACEAAGVRYGLVEQETWEGDPFGCMAASRDYLLGLLHEKE